MFFQASNFNLNNCLSCNFLLFFCFNLGLEQHSRPDFKLLCRKNTHRQVLLLVFERSTMLLLWIKYDLSVLSLLFHRQPSKNGGAQCQHAFGFPISSRFLIVSISASGSYFEKWLSKEQIFPHCRCWLIQLFNHVANEHTIYTNGTYSFEWLIAKDLVEISSWRVLGLGLFLCQNCIFFCISSSYSMQGREGGLEPIAPTGNLE